MATPEAKNTVGTTQITVILHYHVFFCMKTPFKCSFHLNSRNNHPVYQHQC